MRQGRRNPLAAETRQQQGGGDGGSRREADPDADGSHVSGNRQPDAEGRAHRPVADQRDDHRCARIQASPQNAGRHRARRVVDSGSARRGGAGRRRSLRLHLRPPRRDGAAGRLRPRSGGTERRLLRCRGQGPWRGPWRGSRAALPRPPEPPRGRCARLPPEAVRSGGRRRSPRRGSGRHGRRRRPSRGRSSAPRSAARRRASPAAAGQVVPRADSRARYIVTRSIGNSVNAIACV